jgi:uncharacterized protein YndB with AHSA1/START domain
LTFTVTYPVRGSLDEVWRVLGNFGGGHVWTKTITACARDTPDVRVGTTRRCRLPRPLMGRREVHETLTEYEPGRALRYILDGEAGPFATAASRWSTSPTASGATAVTVEGTFTPRSRLVGIFVWPAARPALRRLTRKVLKELDTFVVSGVPT